MASTMLGSLRKWAESLVSRMAEERPPDKAHDSFRHRANTNQPHFIAFKSFWRWATEKKPHNLRLLLGKRWEEWWNDVGLARPDEKDAIKSAGEDVAAQAEFISWVRQYTTVPKYRRAGELTLFMLAHQPPFDNWQGFEPYRSPDNQHGTYTVTAEPGSIRKIFVILSPKSRPDDIEAQAINFQLSGNALDQAMASVNSLFTGTGFWRLVCRWLLTGRKVYVSRFHKYATRTLATTGALIVLFTILFIITADPLEYFKDDATLLWVSALLIAVSLAMVLWSCVSACFEIFFRARPQGKRWAKLLQASQAFVLTDRPNPPIEGPSCGVALALCVLLALDEADPVTERESPFWRQFADRLKQSASTWAVSAEALDNGRMGNVKLHDDKLQAVLDHNQRATDDKKITDLIMPDQKVVKRLRRKPEREQDAGHDNRDANLTSRREAAQDVTGQSHTYAKAAGESKLQVRSCYTVAKLCLDCGRPASERFIVLMSHLCSALLIGIALVAVQQSYQLNRFPPYRLYSALQKNAQGGNLQLTIHTDDPLLFAAKFASCYWASRPAEQFAPDPLIPSQWSVDIKLERHNSPDPACNFLDGNVEVQRLRTFFWRRLPPTRVSREPLWHVARDFVDQLQKIASEADGAQPEFSVDYDNQP